MQRHTRGSVGLSRRASDVGSHFLPLDCVIQLSLSSSSCSLLQAASLFDPTLFISRYLKGRNDLMTFSSSSRTFQPGVVVAVLVSHKVSLKHQRLSTD
jgi:hypothetical protein